MLGLTFKLENPQRTIRKINRVMGRKLNKVSEDSIRLAFAKELNDALLAHPAYASLVNGGPDSLAAEFGFRSGERLSRVNAIIEAIIDSIVLKKTIIQRDKSFQMKIQVRGIPVGYQDLKSLPAATVKSKGGDVPWLEWMLEGQASEIKGYEIKYGTGFPNSRSGYAVMEAVPVGGYRIGDSGNPNADINKFAGSSGKNFVKEAIQEISETELSRLIKQKSRGPYNERIKHRF